MARRTWCVQCHQPAEGEACPRCGQLPQELEVHAEAERSAPVVFQKLKAWQRQQARVQGSEPFMVMPNKALAALAAAQPETLEDLMEVPGVGPKKARDYGAVVLRFFRRLHAGEDVQPQVARAPMPEGLSEAEQAEVVDLREAAEPLSAGAAKRGVALEAHLAHVAALVEKGAVDLPHIYCSPAEVAWLTPLLEADPSLAPDALRAQVPEASLAAVHLLPALARFRRTRGGEEAQDA